MGKEKGPGTVPGPFLDAVLIIGVWVNCCATSNVFIFSGLGAEWA